MSGSSSSSHIAVSPNVAWHGEFDIGMLVVRPGNLLSPKLDMDIAGEISGVRFLELVIAPLQFCFFLLVRSLTSSSSSVFDSESELLVDSDEELQFSCFRDESFA